VSHDPSEIIMMSITEINMMTFMIIIKVGNSSYLCGNRHKFFSGFFDKVQKNSIYLKYNLLL